MKKSQIADRRKNVLNLTDNRFATGQFNRKITELRIQRIRI
jgi:hypothetical protein